MKTPSFSALNRTLSKLPAALLRTTATLALSLLLALVIQPMFALPMVKLLARVCLAALALQGTWEWAGRWRQTWLPRPVMQMLAMCLGVPLATLLAYVVFDAGDVATALGRPGVAPGFLVIAACAWLIGMLVALAALSRERAAQARADSLQFALEKSALEQKTLDSQLRLLQAQIEPHFLFNTLSNVEALVEAGSPRAAPVLHHLIAYLRSAMPHLTDTQASLADEISLVRSYLELMHMRMPDRLQFQIDLAPELGSMRFPPMALLTLVENAVQHGIDPQFDGGTIFVGGRTLDHGNILLWVADNGVGMSETALPGTGLANLRGRLLAYYGADAAIELLENQPSGLRVELLLPRPPEGSHAN